MSVPIDMDLGPPPRTIYEDIVNLPDPVQLGITARFHNYDDVALYFRITASHANWTFGSVDLGSVGSGASIYRNLDQFGSRERPTTEVQETIDFVLRAYTDAGYTDLKWTFHRNITISFINSADPSYTTDFLNNFDDGTVQGWAAAAEVGDVPALGVATDYVLSTPYSLKMTQSNAVIGLKEARARMYKSFATPNKDVIYAIIDLRPHPYTPVGAEYSRGKNIRVQRDATILVYLGRPYDTVDAHYIPMGKWIRIVVPLPKNITIELRIVYNTLHYNTASSALDPASLAYIYMDDFKIISK